MNDGFNAEEIAYDVCGETTRWFDLLLSYDRGAVPAVGGSCMLVVRREKWLQGGLVSGVGLATFAVQTVAAILTGPAASGLTFHEAVAELGLRPVWVLSGWGAYCLLVTASIVLLGARSGEPPRNGRALRLIAAPFWTCGAVGGPWFIIMNAAWGPLWEDHPGPPLRGMALRISELASWLWLLSVPCLIAAGILSRILYVRSLSVRSDNDAPAASE